MTRVMFVGLACFDVVTVCDRWPDEDSDTQVEAQKLRRGGNASNSCTCFSCLIAWQRRRGGDDFSCDTEVEFFGTLGGDVGAEFLERDMKSAGIFVDHVVKHQDMPSPLAVILINKSNGSRTIFYCHKNVPELTFADFTERIDTSSYAWIHMEARKNAPEILQIIRHVRQQQQQQQDENGARHTTQQQQWRRVTLSMEIEKPTKSREVFFAEDVDYYFISKDYAKWKGAVDASESLEVVSRMIPSGRTAVLICAWAESGARAAVVESGIISRSYSSPAFAPKGGLVDTTGAGDSFIAAMVFALQVLHLDLREALTFGCRFAGAKCGTSGNRGLHDFEQFL